MPHSKFGVRCLVSALVTVNEVDRSTYNVPTAIAGGTDFINNGMKVARPTFVLLR